MHALYYLDTLAGGGFGIVFPKTQTRRRGAILSDLQTKEVFVKACSNTETHSRLVCTQVIQKSLC